MKQKENIAEKELLEIPGVGKSIAADLMNLGIRSVKELRKKDPQKLYDRLCRMEGTKVDRCVLYVFRCAVYYASTEKPDTALLKWWNWKDRS